ncbi:hypothetical protein DFJ74DRAFT_713448 [Hyaloraphidium curvatum]|nr:hypothetical protein DFJ74DRAFT_713448 [Hyaloraphidium curvatum]
MANEAAALAFFDAFATKDLDKICSFLADDATILNHPTPPAQSKAQWREGMAGFIGACKEIVFVIDHIATGADGSVFSERVDKFSMNGKWLELPVVGVMEFNSEGKISAWREFWDMASFQKQMAAMTPQ